MDIALSTIKGIGPARLKALQAAGITSGMQVFEYIMSGADGAGAASGIVGAVDPFAALDEMIASVRRAKDMLTQGRDWNENLPRIDHT